MKRGETWWVDLGEPRGSEPGFRRPVVIVQDDLLTESRLGTVMIAPITSNLRRGLAMGNVTLDANASGLSRQCVILVCQLMTIDKTLLDTPIGALSKRQLRDVDRGLSLALGLNE